MAVQHPNRDDRRPGRRGTAPRRMRTRIVHAVTRPTLVLGGALGVVATLAFPAIGSAAITSTTITSPTGPWYAIDNAQAASDPTVTVTGTTNSTDAGVDQVNLLCTYDNTSSNTLASGVALNASGGFTADVPFNSFPDRPCYLRAVPTTGGGSSYWSNYPGPIASVSDISVSTISGGPNDGKLRSFTFRSVNAKSLYAIGSLGADAVTEAQGMSESLNDSNDSIQLGLALNSTNPVKFGESALRVDGVNAYTIGSAVGRAGGTGTPGLPTLEVTAALDSRGIPALTETSGVVACNDETNCTEFVPLGIRVERTYSFARSGAIAFVRDTFTSTDGASHTVVPAYQTKGHNDEMGVSFDGTQYMDRFGASSPPLTFTAGPITAYVQETDDEPNFGEESRSLGQTWRAAPAGIFGFNNTGADWVSPYAGTVPASGSYSIDMALQVAWGVIPLTSAILYTEDLWSSPTTTVGYPTPDSSLGSNWVWVMGQSQARRSFGYWSTPTVSVNGRTASVAPDGSWSVALPLSAGSNTITATATNSAGSTATGSVSVTSANTAVITPQKAIRLTRGISRTGKRSMNIGGRLTPPAGVRKPNTCTGWVKVTTTRGKKRLGLTWGAVRTDCTWRAKITAPAKGSATVSSRFNGNPDVLPISAKSLRITARR